MEKIDTNDYLKYTKAITPRKGCQEENLYFFKKGVRRQTAKFLIPGVCRLTPFLKIFPCA